jgi:hemerythrin HHE cation binding domain-containing protein
MAHVLPEQCNMISTATHTPDKAGLQGTLAKDHEQLDALFERLLAAFHADAGRELCPLWAEFDSRLRAHLALEEELILPQFARVDPTEARCLADEHVRIRKLLSELDIAVDLHLAHERTIADLVTLLRAHGRREDALMYRWAAASLSPAQQTTILGELRRAVGKLIGHD